MNHNLANDKPQHPGKEKLNKIKNSTSKYWRWGGVDFWSAETGWIKGNIWEDIFDKVDAGEKGPACTLDEFWKFINSTTEFTDKYPDELIKKG